MKTLISLVFFFSALAQATVIESAHYEPITQKLYLEVVYQGGAKSHSFDLQWDECQNYVEGWQQTSGRLVDSGWDDAGTTEIRRTLVFDMTFFNCKPALVTIRSGRYSQVTFTLTR